MDLLTPHHYKGFLDELQKLAASKQRMAVPQTRSGRRSMRVDTLLKKDREGTLFKKHWHDHLPGGLADKKKPQDFDPKALAQGQKVESEHTSRPEIAEEIAMDHLTEDPHYYTKLRKMEAGEGEEKRAFTLQGHTQVQGLPISIENRKGSVRKGVDKDGKPWRTVFKIPYGYITGTEGNDGEEIDVYVGPDKKAPNAFVVHQRKITGKGYDEDKVMLGFTSEEAARAAYLEHYNSVGKKLLGPISTITVEELRRRLAEKRKHKKIATVDPSNTTLYADRVGAQQPKKSGDFPDMEGSDSPTSKLAWDGVGSTGGLGSVAMGKIDSEEKPDRSKRGDVPSRDGTSPGSALTVKHEAGPDFVTTLPTAAATADAGSQTGATTRM